MLIVIFLWWRYRYLITGVIVIFAILLGLFLYYQPYLYSLIFSSHLTSHHYFKVRIIKSYRSFYLARVNFHCNVIIYKATYLHLKLNDVVYIKGFLKPVAKSNLFLYSLKVKYIVDHCYVNYDALTHHFHLRNVIISYFSSSKIHNFLFDLGKLLVFNIKTPNGTLIYNWALKYNVVQYFVISGLHILCLLALFNVLFAKHLKIASFFVILILFIYAFALNFSIPITRFWLTYTLSWCFGFVKRVKINKFHVFALVLLLYLGVDARYLFNLTFAFSFVLLLIRTPKFFYKPFLLQLFLINVTGFCSSAILLLIFHLPINITGLFLSFILFFVIEILYVFFWFFIYFKFLYAWPLLKLAVLLINFKGNILYNIKHCYEARFVF